MSDENEFSTFLTDFITGRKVPHVGAESNRQVVERYLVEQKAYNKTDIQVDAPIRVSVNGEPYSATVDLIVAVDGTKVMAVRCVAGSPGSWEREILSAARLLEAYQIPRAIVSDGQRAIVLDTVTGKTVGSEMADIPSKKAAADLIQDKNLRPYPEERLEREKIIFRSYDMMKINITR
jgi:Type I restriction enzyme R protein N terminus (HSDR_N)